MSTLYKSPTIGTIITDLSAASTAEINYLDSFLTILNSSKPTTYSCYDPTGNYATRLPATITPKLAYAVMYFNTVMPVDGVLFNKSSGTYWFIGLDSPNNRCNIYKIVNEAVELIPDKLSILELREELREVGESGYEAWVASMKDKLVYDSTGNQIVSSKKLYIEGQDSDGVGLVVEEKSTFNDNINVAGNIIAAVSGSPVNYFVEAHELKVDQIKVHDTPTGQERATVSVLNADLAVGASGETRKILLNGAEVDGYVSAAVGGTATPIKLKFWLGTQAQYDALVTKDNDTLYTVTE